MPDLPWLIEVTVPGPQRPPELNWVDGRPVLVHYGNLPESDVTVKDGIPVTTPLRTVIDMATRVAPRELERMVEDCLERRLFTIEEARHRLGEPDMSRHRGAALVRRALRRWGELS